MHMCTHTYTQTHPPACACKHARKHVLVKSTHVGHAMGWRANARANASRRTAQRAPRQDAMCSIRQKKSQAECTSGGEVYRTRTFESRPTSGPPLPFQPLFGAFVVVTSNLQASHQSLARWQGNAQIPAWAPRLLARMQRTCSFLARTLPMSKHASLPAVGVAFTFTSSSPTRKPASAAWPPPLNPVSRRPLVATAPSHERILSQAAQDRRPCMSRIARAPPINHAALQCKPRVNRQIEKWSVTWQFGVTELEFFVAQNWP